MQVIQLQIIGMMKEGEKPLTSTVTGVEMFRKILDRGEAGDNAGILLRGIEKDQIRPWNGYLQARFCKTTQEIQV